MQQIIKGWITISHDPWFDDGEIFLSKRDNKKVEYEDDGRQLRLLMSNVFEKMGKEDLKTYADYECGVNGRYQIDNVQIQLFASDVRTKLEDIKEKVVLNAMGLLEFEEHWYGYSSWTIEGFNTHSFKLGGHNLLEILKNYEGKWMYLIVDIVS